MGFKSRKGMKWRKAWGTTHYYYGEKGGYGHCFQSARDSQWCAGTYNMFKSGMKTLAEAKKAVERSLHG